MSTTYGRSYEQSYVDHMNKNTYDLHMKIHDHMWRCCLSLLESFQKMRKEMNKYDIKLHIQVYRGVTLTNQILMHSTLCSLYDGKKIFLQLTI